MCRAASRKDESSLPRLIGCLVFDIIAAMYICEMLFKIKAYRKTIKIYCNMFLHMIYSLREAQDRIEKACDPCPAEAGETTMHGGKKMKKIDQKKISFWLKGLDVVLALMGLVLALVMTFAYLYIREVLPGMLWTSVFFLWFGVIFYGAILFEFWKVCTQIGKMNSFSMENAKAFDRMSIAGMAEAVGFLSKLVWLLVQRSLAPAVAGLIVFEILAACIFVVLTGALSKLIQNAYEMKRENELTI